MKTRIKALVKGFTDTGRYPYVYGKLACGHTCDIPLRPNEIECRKCGHVGPFVEPPPDAVLRIEVCASCGSSSGGNYTFTPDPHCAEHQLAAVGDEVDCGYCDRFEEALAALRALDMATIAHARYREWGGRGVYYVYRRAPESPSGVLLEMSIEARPEAERVLFEKHISALSPTESR